MIAPRLVVSFVDISCYEPEQVNKPEPKHESANSWMSH